MPDIMGIMVEESDNKFNDIELYEMLRRGDERELRHLITITRQQARGLKHDLNDIL